MNLFRQNDHIDREIERVLCQLEKLEADTEDYKAAVNNLKVLYEVRSYKTDTSISMETLVMAATNILGIFLVLNYEHLHVISSKAVNFIVKGKL